MGQASGVQTEYEVKFTGVDHQQIRDALRAAGASLQTPERTMRRAVYGGEANPGMRCTYGRIRDEGDVITMSAKFSATNNAIDSQKEAVIRIDDFESAHAILDAFGLVMTDHQENKRETWRCQDGTLVELETWPDLPPYLEIEGPSIEAIQQVAAHLSLDWDQHTTDPTNLLYEKLLGLSPEQTREKMANLRFSQ